MGETKKGKMSTWHAFIHVDKLEEVQVRARSRKEAIDRASSAWDLQTTSTESETIGEITVSEVK